MVLFSIPFITCFLYNDFLVKPSAFAKSDTPAFAVAVDFDDYGNHNSIVTFCPSVLRFIAA